MPTVGELRARAAQKRIMEQFSLSRPSDNNLAAERDKMTRHLVFALIYGGHSVPTKETVNGCRELARYIQETNEEIDY